MMDDNVVNSQSADIVTNRSIYIDIGSFISELAVKS